MSPGARCGEVEQHAVGDSSTRAGSSPARRRSGRCACARRSGCRRGRSDHDQVARGQRVHAVLGGADPLGELGVALVHAQRRRRHAREREHVGVDGHGEVDDASQASSFSSSAASIRCWCMAAAAASPSRARRASRIGTWRSDSASRSMPGLRDREVGPRVRLEERPLALQRGVAGGAHDRRVERRVGLRLVVRVAAPGGVAHRLQQLGQLQQLVLGHPLGGQPGGERLERRADGERLQQLARR